MYTLNVIHVWVLHLMRFISMILYSLDGNSITHNEAGMLADVLKVNQSLQNLRSVAESSIILVVYYAIHATP